jgi:uncharacterized protein YcaQ
MKLTLDALRRFAISRSLFPPTTLPTALAQLGFVQADPIRAPARAQDLILRHRVKNYHAGELERRYASLEIEEDFFVNYGFVSRDLQALMHPRTARTAWTKAEAAKAEAVRAFVAERGIVHPREVDAEFAHGRVQNWFGGSSNASTQLLDAMHYRGLLRVAGRASGVRLYALPVNPSVHESADPADAMDALVDVIVQKYAPLPERSLRELIGHLRGGVPQWSPLRAAAFARAKERLASAVLDGVTWYWPASENPEVSHHKAPDTVRLLAPFDPVVWDRRRFELFWGWAYRFEAYTPAAKRIRGYYAMPLLWRDQVIGWGNLSVKDRQLTADLGYVTGHAPREKAFKAQLGEELARVEDFLNLKA